MNETQQKLIWCTQTSIAPNNSEIDNPKLRRALFTKNNLWPTGTNITVGFIGDGENTVLQQDFQLNDEDPLNIEIMNLLRQSPRKITIKEAIKRIVRERIEPIVNLKFIFIEDPFQAQLKISFDGNRGSNANLGYGGDNVYHTMNYAWFNVHVVLHGCGHLIGLYHEHQSPIENSISWDKEAIYRMMIEIHKWTKEQIDDNILNNLDKESINGSTFDPLSIMQYPYPPEWTTNKVGSKLNGRFSGKDVLWICKTYPKQNEDPIVTAENFYQRVYGESLQSSIDKSERMAIEFRVGTIKPVPTVPTVPTVITVPPVPTVPSKLDSKKIWVVFGIVSGLVILMLIANLFLRIKM